MYCAILGSRNYSAQSRDFENAQRNLKIARNRYMFIICCSDSSARRKANPKYIGWNSHLYEIFSFQVCKLMTTTLLPALIMECCM